MSCDYPRSILQGYLDGELDAVRSAEFELHLESCEECTHALGAEEALHSLLQRNALYERASADLRRKINVGIHAATRAEAAKAEPRRAAWRWLAVAAGILLVAAVSWFALPALRNPGAPVLTATELIDAHVRSLQPGHLTDVASTDQHTVKPWFDGKLDFIPPVKDYTEEGFPLVGGRLDVLNGRTVAALVYGRRKHLINVFVWPTKEPDTSLHLPSPRQGYSWVHWRHHGMEFCAVSDVSTPDLRELAQLFLNNST